MTDPLSIRANNPIAMRYDKEAWDGLVPGHPSMEGFCNFTSAEMGLRAGAICFLTSYYIHKNKTIQALIYRHAPPNENSTSQYVFSVAKACNMPDSAVFPIKNPTLFTAFLAAVVLKEAGKQWLVPNDYDMAIKQAYSAKASIMV